MTGTTHRLSNVSGPKAILGNEKKSGGLDKQQHESFPALQAWASVDSRLGLGAAVAGAAAAAEERLQLREKANCGNAAEFAPKGPQNFFPKLQNHTVAVDLPPSMSPWFRVRLLFMALSSARMPSGDSKKSQTWLLPLGAEKHRRYCFDMVSWAVRCRCHTLDKVTCSSARIRAVGPNKSENEPTWACNANLSQ